MTAAGKAMMALCEDMLESARMVPHQIAQATKRVEGIVRGGASYSRQRVAAAAARRPGDLRDVVDLLVRELRTDVPGAAA